MPTMKHSDFYPSGCLQWNAPILEMFPNYIFRLPHGPPLGCTKGAHEEVYWFFKLSFVCVCVCVCVRADHVAPSSRKGWHCLRRRAAVLGRCGSLADSGHGVCLFVLYVSMSAWDWYLSIVRTYLYCLLPENTIKLGRLIVDTCIWNEKAIREHRLENEKTKTKNLNSMVWVRERTIPTERPPLVGEVTDNFCG
jgi:hypothetical protein